MYHQNLDCPADCTTRFSGVETGIANPELRHEISAGQLVSCFYNHNEIPALIVEKAIQFKHLPTQSTGV